MPGVTVDEFDGEVVTGRIKVKVGPVSLTYRGTAKFIERDPGAQCGGDRGVRQGDPRRGHRLGDREGVAGARVVRRGAPRSPCTRR